MAFDFEKLIVWRKTAELSEKVNEIVITFPANELYIVVSQFNRAADSISLNIVEGSTGQYAEFKKSLGYAFRSDMETVGCLHLALRRKYISNIGFEDLYKKCEEFLVMINALRKSLIKL